MPDQDGYPINDELDAIRFFDGDIDDFIDTFTRLWIYSDRVSISFVVDDDGREIKRIELSTGGWSGHEEIIEVMRSTMFWMMFWQVSRRGGHYTFDIPIGRGDLHKFTSWGCFFTDRISQRKEWDKND